MQQRNIAHQGQTFQALSFNQNHSGTPIVLIHGLLCSVHFWYPKHLEFLFQYGPVHSIALPAHAPATTPPDWGQLNEATLLRAIEVQIDELVGESPVILMGHSTGGTVALLYALHHPDRVKGVVTMGAAHSGKEEGGVLGFVQWASLNLGAASHWLVKALLWVNGYSVRLHKQFLKDVAADRKGVLKHPDLDDHITRYFPYQKSLDKEAMIPYFRDLIQIDLGERLKQLSTPVLVMCGDKDPYVSRARTQYLTDLMPRSQMCLIKDCGHWPMYEKPEEYCGAISRFIEAVLGEGLKAAG